MSDMERAVYEQSIDAIGNVTSLSIRSNDIQSYQDNYPEFAQIYLKTLSNLMYTRKTPPNSTDSSQASDAQATSAADQIQSNYKNNQVLFKPAAAREEDQRKSAAYGIQ
jgi:hypothetical protein